MIVEPGRLFPDLLTSRYGIARAGPYGYMIKVLPPLSQPSKDVGRFRVAASQAQVAITGQQGP